MNSLKYKGYTARIDFDPEDEIFVGRVVGIKDIIGFHAESAKELQHRLLPGSLQIQHPNCLFQEQ